MNIDELINKASSNTGVKNSGGLSTNTDVGTFLGESAQEVGGQFVSSLARAGRGIAGAVIPGWSEDPTKTSMFERKFIEPQDAYSKAYMSKYANEGNPYKPFAETASSIGYSVAGMLPMAALATPVSAALGGLGLLTALVGSTGVTFFATRGQKIDEYYDYLQGRSQEVLGRELTREELNSMSKELGMQSAATQAALWETVPEVAGNIMMAKIATGGARLGSRLLPKAMQKANTFGSKFAVGAADVFTSGQIEEQLTELVTNKNQGNIDAEIYGTERPGWGETFQQQFAPVAMQTALMGGAFGAGSHIANRFEHGQSLKKLYGMANGATNMMITRRIESMNAPKPEDNPGDYEARKLDFESRSIETFSEMLHSENDGIDHKRAKEIANIYAKNNPQLAETMNALVAAKETYETNLKAYLDGQEGAPVKATPEEIELKKAELERDYLDTRLILSTPFFNSPSAKEGVKGYDEKKLGTQKALAQYVAREDGTTDITRLAAIRLKAENLGKRLDSEGKDAGNKYEPIIKMTTDMISEADKKQQTKVEPEVKQVEPEVTQQGISEEEFTQLMGTQREAELKDELLQEQGILKNVNNPRVRKKQAIKRIDEIKKELVILGTQKRKPSRTPIIIPKEQQPTISTDYQDTAATLRPPTTEQDLINEEQRVGQPTDLITNEPVVQQTSNEIIPQETNAQTAQVAPQQVVAPIPVVEETGAHPEPVMPIEEAKRRYNKLADLEFETDRTKLYKMAIGLGIDETAAQAMTTDKLASAIKEATIVKLDKVTDGKFSQQEQFTGNPVDEIDNLTGDEVRKRAYDLRIPKYNSEKIPVLRDILKQKRDVQIAEANAPKETEAATKAVAPKVSEPKSSVGTTPKANTVVAKSKEKESVVKAEAKLVETKPVVAKTAPTQGERLEKSGEIEKAKPAPEIPKVTETQGERMVREEREKKEAEAKKAAELKAIADKRAADKKDNIAKLKIIADKAKELEEASNSEADEIQKTIDFGDMQLINFAIERIDSEIELVGKDINRAKGSVKNDYQNRLKKLQTYKKNLSDKVTEIIRSWDTPVKALFDNNPLLTSQDKETILDDVNKTVAELDTETAKEQKAQATKLSELEKDLKRLDDDLSLERSKPSNKVNKTMVDNLVADIKVAKSEIKKFKKSMGISEPTVKKESKPRTAKTLKAQAIADAKEESQSQELIDGMTAEEAATKMREDGLRDIELRDVEIGNGTEFKKEDIDNANSSKENHELSFLAWYIRNRKELNSKYSNELNNTIQVFDGYTKKMVESVNGEVALRKYYIDMLTKSALDGKTISNDILNNLTYKESRQVKQATGNNSNIVRFIDPTNKQDKSKQPSMSRTIEIITRVMKRFRNRFDIIAVNSVWDIEDVSVRQDFIDRLMEGKNTDRTTPAFWDVTSNRIYVIHNNVATEDKLFEAIIHETVGHIGLEMTLGSHFDSVMNEIYVWAAKNQPEAIDKIIEKYGYERSQKLSIAKELAAHWTSNEIKEDTGELTTLMDKFKATIKYWLSQLARTFGLAKKDINEFDINALFVRSAQWARGEIFIGSDGKYTADAGHMINKLDENFTEDGDPAYNEFLATRKMLLNLSSNNPDAKVTENFFNEKLIDPKTGKEVPRHEIMFSINGELNDIALDMKKSFKDVSAETVPTLKALLKVWKDNLFGTSPIRYQRSDRRAFETYLMSPEISFTTARNHQLNPFYFFASKQNDDKNQIISDIAEFHISDVLGEKNHSLLTKIQDLERHYPKEYQKINKLLVDADKNYKNLGIKFVLTKYSENGKAIDRVEFVETSDTERNDSNIHYRKKEKIYADINEARKENGSELSFEFDEALMGKNGIKTVQEKELYKAIRKVCLNELKVKMEELESYKKDASDNGNNNKVFSFDAGGETIQVNLNNLINSMGELSASYFPRIRNRGDLSLYVYNREKDSSGAFVMDENAKKEIQVLRDNAQGNKKEIEFIDTYLKNKTMRMHEDEWANPDDYGINASKGSDIKRSLDYIISNGYINLESPKFIVGNEIELTKVKTRLEAERNKDGSPKWTIDFTPIASQSSNMVQSYGTMVRAGDILNAALKAVRDRMGKPEYKDWNAFTTKNTIEIVERKRKSDGKLQKQLIVNISDNSYNLSMSQAQGELRKSQSLYETKKGKLYPEHEDGRYIFDLGDVYDNSREGLNNEEQSLYKTIQETVINKLQMNSHSIAESQMNELELSLNESLSDTIKSLGLRQSTISRSKKRGVDVVEGYETDAQKALAAAVERTATGISKSRATKGMIGALFGTNDVPKPRLESYYKMKNRESFDDANSPESEYEHSLDENGVEIMDKDHRILGEEEYQRYNDDMHLYLKVIKENSIDPNTQPKMYEEALTYIFDQIRPNDVIDRTIGMLKGWATLKFLAFNVASPAVNLTTLATSLPGVMNAHTGMSFLDCFKNIGRAMDIYKTFLFHPEKLTGDMRLIMKEIHEKGWNIPQFSQRNLDALRGNFGSTANRMIDLVMTPFSESEKLIRIVSILSPYLYFSDKYKNKTLTKEDLNRLQTFREITNFKTKNKYDRKYKTEKLDTNTRIIDQMLEDMKLGNGNPGEYFFSFMADIGKSISDRANGEYGKYARPYLVQKFRPLDIMMIFMKFPHTYLMNMGQFAMDKDQRKAALYMLFAPMFIGGVGAAPLYPFLMPMIKPILQGLFETDDPEEDFYRYVAEISEPLGKSLRMGGMANLGVSLKGSMQLQIPSVSNSIPGELFREIKEMGQFLAQGDMTRFIERTPLTPRMLASTEKAIREYTYGVTSKRNTPVFYGEEQIRPTAKEAILSSMGFSAARPAAQREEVFNDEETIKRYQTRREALNARYKKYYMEKPRDTDELNAIMKEALKFNDRLKRDMERGVVSKGAMQLVTKDSLTRMAKMSNKPKKFQKNKFTND